MSLKRLCLFTHRYSLALVMALVLGTATTDDSGPPVNITAVVGHTATFKCPNQKSWIVTRLYIQKHDEFINGFDKLKDLPSKYLNRTTVNRTNLSMEMTNVTVLDEGLYKCIVFYKEDNPTTAPKKDISYIYLKVTGKYSVPTIEKECSERKNGDGTAGKSCRLSCSSTGGYPQSAVKWAELNLSLMSVVHNESSEDPSSKTWTVNQTIAYDCVHATNVSCAVDGAVSPIITICETESFSFEVIAAIVLVLVFVLLLLLVCMVICCRRRRTEDQGDPENADVPLADCHSQLKSV
ncbi:hypothetical protein R3I93_003865 [Phoxinus phoxinus]|uniref:Ig-like domain-containing protein n=1 Tax=Phoxinus phoxinus TaxID=58324 RepID=A0AAN9DE35_9TELE